MVSVSLVLTSASDRAGLAGLVPGLAHIVGTAAYPPGYVEGQLIATCCAIVVSVANTFSHVWRNRHNRIGIPHGSVLSPQSQRILLQLIIHMTHPCSCFPR